jgi:hypothetical protein
VTNPPPLAGCELSAGSGFQAEVLVPAEDDVGVLGRTLTLDVSVFGVHPLRPLRSRVFAVALEAALQSYLAGRLDPDRVGEIRLESLT